MEYRPVCGNDGKQYSNPCMARCAGITIFKEGECSKPVPSTPASEAGCVCPALYKPVCATDPATKLPKSYGNSCQAGCAKAAFLYDGECGNKGGDVDVFLCTQLHVPHSCRKGWPFRTACQSLG